MHINSLRQSHLKQKNTGWYTGNKVVLYINECKALLYIVNNQLIIAILKK